MLGGVAEGLRGAAEVVALVEVVYMDDAARVEFELTPFQLPDGPTFQMIGPNYATGKEFGWAVMDVSSLPAKPLIVKGLPVKAVVMGDPGSHGLLP